MVAIFLTLPRTRLRSTILPIHQGSFLRFSTTDIRIINYSSSPSVISATFYHGVSYSHQGWVIDEKDQSYLLMNDELDEMFQRGSVNQLQIFRSDQTFCDRLGNRPEDHHLYLGHQGPLAPCSYGPLQIARGRNRPQSLRCCMASDLPALTFILIFSTERSRLREQLQKRAAHRRCVQCCRGPYWRRVLRGCVL
jgi:hypothetical protein